MSSTTFYNSQSLVGIGSVGIGTTNPVATLDIVDQTNAPLQITEYNDTDGAIIRGRSAKGTAAAPTGVVADSPLTALRGFGYTSAGAFSGRTVGIELCAAETFTASATGSYIRFDTSASGGTSYSEKMRILGNGRVGIGSAIPGAPLVAVSTATNPGNAGIAQFLAPNLTSGSQARICLGQRGGSDSATPSDGAYIDYTNYSSAGASKNTFSIGFTQGASDVFFVQSSGNVGIGITTPVVSLDVLGSAKIYGGSQVARLILGPSPSGTNLDYCSVIESTSQTSTNYLSQLKFYTHGTGATGADPTLAMTIDYRQYVGIGTPTPTVALTVQPPSSGGPPINVAVFNTGAGTGIFYVQDPGTTAGSSQGWNTTISSVLYVGRPTATSAGRSINAGGSINAAGADYAEYMTKSGNFIVLKGDLIGVNSSALLTNVFADAVSFVVKSSEPSYVGGDTWGSEEVLGVQKPEAVLETDPGYAEYQTKLDIFNTARETARARVDRIAFAGQVPVNVLGATPGQYIVPIAKEDGSIGGQAVSNPTMEQYMAAIGKVIKVLPDGRASVIVKVV